MDTDRVAARVVKSLVTMRGAAVALHSAGIDRHHHDARAALTTIDSEYFELRDFLNRLAADSRHHPG